MNKPNVNVMVGGPINEDYPRIYKTKYIKPLIPLSGQITDVNTKYVIRYNHNLDGEEVIVPEGCTIEFDGGSITNGTLVGDNTRLVYEGSLDSFVIDAELKGTFIHNDDRPYDSSNGLYSQGQVTFEKNIINGKNVLTQDMFMKDDPENPGRRIPNTNTVFVIKYDFYLTLDSFYDECYDSARDYHYISLPNNCVLKFEGGCIHNENFRYIEDGVIKYNDYRLRIEAGNNCLVIEDGHMILDYVPIGYRFNNEFLMASSIGVNQQNTLDNGAGNTLRHKVGCYSLWKQLYYRRTCMYSSRRW